MDGEELPPGWAWATLAELCEVNPTTDTSHVAPTQEVAFIPMAAVAELLNKVDTSRRRKHLEVSKGFTRFATGDVLFAKITPCMENGKIAEVPDVPANVAYGSTEFHVLRPRPGISASYVRHFVAQQHFRETARRHMSGAVGQQRVPIAFLRDATLPVPPSPEQVRVAQVIDELFDQLDEAEAALARAREGVERFRASLLHAACTGQLTAAWRAAHPPTETGADLLRRILAERRAAWERTERARLEAKGTPPRGDAWKARYVEPVAPDVTDMPELPEGWVWASIDQLISTMTSGSRAWAPYYDRGSGVFIMAQNVRPGRLDLQHLQMVDPPENDPERRRTRVRKDDLLITIVGANTGDVCRVEDELTDHYVCQSVALLRPIDPAVSPMLTAYLVSPSDGRAVLNKLAYGAGRPHLSFDQLKAVAVPVPPSDEREQVLRSISQCMGESDIDKDIDRPKGMIRDLRQSILHAAFTGRLVSQDPADEPASALLAWLRETVPPMRRARRRATAEASA